MSLLEPSGLAQAGASRAEQLAALRLARSTEIGPITFRNLMERYGSAQSALEALPGLAERGGRAGQIRLQSAADAERELHAAENLGAHLLIAGMPGYPELLFASEGAPCVLFVRGRPEILALPSLAIVGARNASANGRKLAESLAAGLAAKGFIIVSGLARGIDAAAHRGSLASGTTAVLAGGVDQVYPSENAALYEAICEHGAVVSEMPLGYVARSADFPRRNRIIAGLARGTIVVEAAERSGSLITARLAAEMGREVFAIPGSPLDARCKGTNQLLKDGAVLVETIDDVIANLPAHASPPLRFNPASDRAARPRLQPATQAVPDAASAAGPSSLARTVLELLGPSPTSVDELVRLTGAGAAEIQAALLDLEIEGLTLRHPGQLVSRSA